MWFAVIATGLTAPLWRDPAHTILGETLYDNISFAWNFWWAKQAVLQQAGASPDASIFATDALFAPLGPSLLLHTGTPLLTVFNALALPALEPVASYNLWIWLSLCLNGLCVYGAAYQATRRHDAALLGGTIFATAPFLTVRMNGHLNVLSAWVLPLFVIAIERMFARPSVMRAVLAGAALGACAYVDYYYSVYAVLLGVILWACRRPQQRSREWHLAHLLVAIAAACVMVAPIIVAAIGVWASGDYIPSRRFWRGAFPGIDIASVVLGNPTSALFGVLPERAYRHLGIDVMESVCWLGVAPTVLLLMGVMAVMRRQPRREPQQLEQWPQREQRDRADIRLWLLVLAIFALWALGPSLIAFGVNTKLPLPQTVMRFVPIVNHARVPGRAFTLVLLATAMIAAIVVASRIEGSRVEGGGRRRWAWVAMLIGVTLLDFWPRPHRAIALEQSSIYTHLSGGPRRVLLELPLGFRDGLAARGSFDHAALYAQMSHAQPLVGGFVARLSPGVRERYERDFVFGRLLTLADGKQVPLNPPAESLVCSVGLVAMPADLDAATRAFVDTVFVLQPLAASPTRSLFVVAGFHAPFCARGAIDR